MELSLLDDSMLTAQQLRYSKRVYRNLLAAKLRIDIWVNGEGFDIRRLKMIEAVRGILFQSSDSESPTIYLNLGLSWMEEVETVSHELCHAKFHKPCVAYRDLTKQENLRDETNAELFAFFVRARLEIKGKSLKLEGDRQLKNKEGTR